MKIDYTQYIGKTISRLSILGMGTPKKYGKKKSPTITFKVKCECGNTKEMGALNIVKSHTKSCGCFGNELRHSNKSTGIGKDSLRWNGYKNVSGRSWYSIKKSAAYRNISVEVTIEYVGDLLESQGSRCAISGIPIGITKPQTASLDRIDSSRGYVIGNVQWVHKDINLMKQRMTQEIFLSWIQLISKYQKFS